MYKLLVYYEDKIVTYLLSPHIEVCRYMRDKIEADAKRCNQNFWFNLQEVKGD